MAEGLQWFKETVREILVRNCLECHGGDSVKAGFDLSSREDLLESGYVEASSTDSILMDLIRHEAEPAMPHRRGKLTEGAIAAIARWIDLGVPYDKSLVADTAQAAKAGRQVTESDREFWSF